MWRISNLKQWKLGIRRALWTHKCIQLNNPFRVQPPPASSLYCKPTCIISTLTNWCGNCCYVMTSQEATAKLLREWWKCNECARHGAHYFFVCLYNLSCPTHASQKEHKNNCNKELDFDVGIRLYKLRFSVSSMGLLVDIWKDLTEYAGVSGTKSVLTERFDAEPKHHNKSSRTCLWQCLRL